MRRSFAFASLITVFSCIAVASAPIANMTSKQAITLDGHGLAAVGIASWPLVMGDEVATSGAPGIILFNDGSSIQLASRSAIKIVGSSAEPKIVLLSGSLDYKFVSGSKLSVTNSLTAAREAVADETPTFSVTKTVKTSKVNMPLLISAASAGLAAPAVLIAAHGHPGGGTVNSPISNDLSTGDTVSSLAQPNPPRPPPKSVHK